PLVKRQHETGLIDALEDCNGIAGDLADNLLKAQRRAMEKLQRAGYPLLEPVGAPFRRLVYRPGDGSHLSHRGEAVVHCRRITAGLPRIAPGPIDGDSAFAADVLARDMILIIGARGAHD